jgi:CCR4-NOT transcription complex subunit 9
MNPYGAGYYMPHMQYTGGVRRNRSPPYQNSGGDMFSNYISPQQSINSINYTMVPRSFDSTSRDAKFVENAEELELVIENINALKNPEKREKALSELGNKRETLKDLPYILWYSTGTIAILLHEIVQIYPDLSPPRLNHQISSRVCCVLGLLQSLALHPTIRKEFIHAHIPLFLYPFLNTSNKMKFFENVRVTSLGVIGALVKGDDSEAIGFLMQTEIIPLCLRIMKRGQELSRTVATFIVQKILNDPTGLDYICETGERFYAVTTVLSNMIEEMAGASKE